MLLVRKLEGPSTEGLLYGPNRSQAALERRRLADKDYQREQRATKLPTVIAIDGEGKDTPDGKHLYTLLAAVSKTENRTLQGTSLGTKEILDFLLSLPPKTLKVAFSFGYDANMILGDLPEKTLRRLHDTGRTYWRGYFIQNTPRKQFYVRKGKKSCNVWDVFGYFQMSFVRTIHEWGAGTELERELIGKMKAKRSGFAVENDDEIERYCVLECRLLIDVFERLLESTRECGLILTRYDGAGSVASAMLRKENVREFTKPTHPFVHSVLLQAYYGGRFDISQYGQIGTCYGYDIRSAYPYQLLQAPCFAHGDWRPAARFDTNYEMPGIWRVKWDTHGPVAWGPFPFRKRKAVGYYQNGEGFYWNTEVAAACRVYPNDIQVCEGIVWQQDCDHKPFQFIEPYFQKRAEYKARGSLAQMVLKLGLNSLYGKTAQSRGKREPIYQQFAWAGWTTAGTRAMILNQLAYGRDDIVFIATDGIASKAELPLPPDDRRLGDWERSIYEHLFIAQNGVYQARGVDRTRGYNPVDMDFPGMRKRAAREDRFTHRFVERRFIGLGEALQRNPPLQDWRTWKVCEASIEYGRYRGKVLDGHRLSAARNPWTGLPDAFEPGTINRSEILETSEDFVTQIGAEDSRL